MPGGGPSSLPAGRWRRRIVTRTITLPSAGFGGGGAGGAGGHNFLYPGGAQGGGGGGSGGVGGGAQGGALYVSGGTVAISGMLSNNPSVNPQSRSSASGGHGGSGGSGTLQRTADVTTASPGGNGGAGGLAQGGGWDLAETTSSADQRPIGGTTEGGFRGVGGCGGGKGATAPTRGQSARRPAS